MKIISRFTAMLQDNHYYFRLTGCVLLCFNAWWRQGLGGNVLRKNTGKSGCKIVALQKKLIYIELSFTLKATPMKNFLHYFPSIFIFLILFASCKKIEMKPLQSGDAKGSLSLSTNITLSSAAFIPHDDDSIERITVLGVQLTNPYLIPNMTQAYHNLGIYNVPVVVTNLYVRFKPTID
jgi:hypothetical protein